MCWVQAGSAVKCKTQQQNTQRNNDEQNPTALTSAEKKKKADSEFIQSAMILVNSPFLLFSSKVNVDVFHDLPLHVVFLFR